MRRLLVLLDALLCAGLLCAPAGASSSVAVGGFLRDTPSSSGAALLLSTGTSVPTLPLAIQGTLFTPLAAPGGYAATLEVRGLTGGGYGGAYVGAGAGVGTLAGNRSSGTVLTIFAGKSIASLTSIEFRLYKQTQDTGATTAFVGLRFSF